MRINSSRVIHLLLMLSIISGLNAQSKLDSNEILYRPAMHFTPAKGWMNDPNGMFYLDGVYHLYYQHYPNATVWGPMHWGHATSRDLMHWEHKPIAIYPDSIGMIFSGSAVVDKNNSSGLGINGKAPLIAIFTQHNMDGEKAGKIDFQNQSIAYSNDGGISWKMYAGNPVVKNPGIKDFRDPKVIWHEASKKWVMIVAVKNKVSLYSSSNLIAWSKESDFGTELGSHDGVWECPDLISLKYNNKTYWVLTVSINPGGPNKGSATQYFVGNFDGKQFTANSKKTKWMDYGADNYAGVTWSNTGDRKISIGWMSNWIYAQQVPTVNWRSATTTARAFSLQTVKGEMYLSSLPVKEVKFAASKSIQSISRKIASAYKINIPPISLQDFTISLANELGEHVDFGYDKKMNQYFIDRSQAGKHEFNSEFAAKHFAPRISMDNTSNLQIIIDKASIEMFADNGLTVMTDIFFPTSPYTKINVISKDTSLKEKLTISNYLTP
jgi:fructan beta-fructosidase